MVIDWIQAGASQEGAGGSAPEGAADAAPNSWDGDVSAIFQASCAECHGELGDFNVESYDAVMEGIQPGDPDGSLIIQVVEAGNHPGSLSENDLNLVRNWIQAGAPQQ
jgi:mono/diheme cytochrome c family protein